MMLKGYLLGPLLITAGYYFNIRAPPWQTIRTLIVIYLPFILILDHLLLGTFEPTGYCSISMPSQTQGVENACGKEAIAFNSRKNLFLTTITCKLSN